MRPLPVALLVLFVAGCQTRVSPGGGTPGSATPNPNLYYDGGPRPMNNNPPDDETDGGEDNPPIVRDGSVDPFPDVDAGSPDSGPTTSDPGVDRSAFLDELDATDKQALCEWVTAQQGGEGTYTCDNEVMVTVQSVAECVANNTLPHCQAGVMIDCMASLDGDVCNLFVTTECMAFFNCLGGG